jgi:hypothetical protein
MIVLGCIEFHPKVRKMDDCYRGATLNGWCTECAS